MATKKRKVDQEDELLNAPNRPVVYTPAPAEEVNGDDAPADDEAEAEEEEDVGKVLEPLSHDQLVSLLRFAATSNPSVLAEIRRVADLDPAHRKLFVHGLGWETSTEGLRAAFASYGDIDECRVVFDKASGRSKGYGFVLFCNRSAARRALRQPQKLIEGRMTSCQLASAGPTSAATGGADRSHHHNPSHNSGSSASQQDNLPRKIYVGNVHSNIDGGRLLEFFSQFGEIEEGPIGFDRHTGKPKGYALFIYRTQEGAQRALEEPTKYFEGHQLICHKAMDGKSKSTPAANAAVVQQNPASNMAPYNGTSYGSQQVDMVAQQAAMFGPGLLGMTGPQAFGQGMQPNAAAIAMLVAAAQNQAAAFGVTPAMLASLNPAFAAALGAAGSQQTMTVPTSVPQAASTQNYVMGSMGFQAPAYQGNSGFQTPMGFQESATIQAAPAFQGPPGFQGTQPISQQGAAVGAGTYQAAPLATNPIPRPSAGSLGGYGPH